MSNGPEKDIVRGRLECLKCGAMVEFYADHAEQLIERADEMKSYMLDHLNNDCRVPEGTHQPRKDEANG